MGGALMAVVTFIEAVFGLAAERNKSTVNGVDNKRMQYGEKLHAYTMKISEDLMKSIFHVIAQVPTQAQQETIPRVLMSIRDAAGQEKFHGWLQVCLIYLLPASCLSDEERV